MAKKQYFGIKYPFTNEDKENYFVDLNNTRRSAVQSQIMHVIFTPKGQKLRDPEFGTNLIKYIFQPNDSDTWENVRNEIGTAISTYVDNVTLNDISVLKNDEEVSTIYVRVDYNIKDGNVILTDTLITKI